MRKIFVIVLVISCIASCDKEDGGIVMKNKYMQGILLEMYDKNKDGILSKEEALAVTEINVILSKEPIDGLENFPNVEIIIVNGGKFDKLDVSMCKKLKKLYCIQNKLKILDLSANLELEELVCYDGELTYIDVRGLLNLKILNCYDNKIKFLDIKNTNNLRTICCDNNKLTHLYLSSSPQLEELSCDRNFIETLDISNNLNLRALWCYGSENFLHTLFMKEGQTVEKLAINSSVKIVYR